MTEPRVVTAELEVQHRSVGLELATGVTVLALGSPVLALRARLGVAGVPVGGVGLLERLDGWRGLRIGRLAITTAGRQLAHAPRMDGGTLTLRRDGADLGESYGGLVVRYGRQVRGEPQVAALVVAWRGARVPTPWWPPRRAWQLARARRARRHGQLPQPLAHNGYRQAAP